MKNKYDKAAQISDLVVGLELIDRTLASIRSQLTPTPLTQKQLDVVGVLVRKPQGVAIKDIADSLHVTSSAVVQIIDSFGDRQFVGKRTDKSDKRVSIAYVTQDGVKYIRDNLDEFANAYYDQIFDVLEPSEFEQLCRTIQKIAEFIEPTNG